MGDDTDKLTRTLPTAVREVLAFERGWFGRWARENAAVIALALGLAGSLLTGWAVYARQLEDALRLGERGVATAERTERVLLGDPSDPRRPGLVAEMRDVQRRIAAGESGVVSDRAAVVELRNDVVRRLERIDGQQLEILQRLSRMEGSGGSGGGR